MSFENCSLLFAYTVAVLVIYGVLLHCFIYFIIERILIAIFVFRRGTSERSPKLPPWTTRRNRRQPPTPLRPELARRPSEPLSHNSAGRPRTVLPDGHPLGAMTRPSSSSPRGGPGSTNERPVPRSASSVRPRSREMRGSQSA
jgi:hypothetical protein